MQSAVTEALEAWRRDGPPNNPAAWLQTAARHNALDLVRRRTRQDALAAPRTGGDGVRRPLGDRRPARAALRVLPPRLAPEATAGTHPACGGRHDDATDRAGVPGQRAHARAADRAGQAQDRHGRDRPHRARRRRADRAARRRAGGDRADVQRGLRVLRRRHPGPRPRRRRRLAGRRGRDQPAARGRGVGAGRAAHVPARSRRRPLLRRRRPGAAARPGPVALGPRRDRGRRGDARARGGAAGQPVRSSCAPRSRPATRPARRGTRPTGSRSSPCSRC